LPLRAFLGRIGFLGKGGLWGPTVLWTGRLSPGMAGKPLLGPFRGQLWVSHVIALPDGGWLDVCCVPFGIGMRRFSGIKVGKGVMLSG